MMRLQNGDVIHFRSRLWVVMTLSRTITGKVKLAPADRSSRTFVIKANGQEEWLAIDEVERHARFVGYFDSKVEL